MNISVTEPRTRGLNFEEMRVAMGMPSHSGSLWKRASELRQMGLIEDTGVRRPGLFTELQMVSRITPAGAELAQKIMNGEFWEWPEYTSKGARNTDPDTSHAAARGSKGSQRARALLVFYSA